MKMLLVIACCLSVVGLLFMSKVISKEDKFTFDTNPTKNVKTTTVSEEYGLWLK